ncbi:hypothetical protein CGCSCA5_v005358 [Colletotrichum siamense]|nr:hypothetical protein CGCSCA5_v005358 [Colletotrichum siamense]
MLHLATLFTFIAAVVLSIASLACAQGSCRCGDPSFLAIPRVNISSAQPVQNCTPYKILDARGSGEPQVVFLSFQVAIERMIANATQITTQSIIYPASFGENVSVGVQNTVDTIRRGLQDCLNQKYSLLGYSQGATVVLEALGKLDHETKKKPSTLLCLLGIPIAHLGGPPTSTVKDDPIIELNSACSLLKQCRQTGLFPTMMIFLTVAAWSEISVWR